MVERRNSPWTVGVDSPLEVAGDNWLQRYTQGISVVVVNVLVEVMRCGHIRDGILVIYSVISYVPVREVGDGNTHRIRAGQMEGHRGNKDLLLLFLMGSGVVRHVSAERMGIVLVPDKKGNHSCSLPDWYPNSLYYSLPRE